LKLGALCEPVIDSPAIFIFEKRLLMRTLIYLLLTFAVALGFAALAASEVSAQESGQIFTPSDLQWKPGRLPGVSL
jgi:hypothetical protein